MKLYFRIPVRYLLLISIFISPFYTVADSEVKITSEILAEGGKLYDKWWKVYDLKPPEKTHPLYPANGKKKGSTTWRCKECHGWDYRGSSGVYGKGSHFTGVTGIDKYNNHSAEKILTVLKNKTHQYQTVMLEPALLKLAYFVSKGQVDMDQYINYENKTAKGDASLGKAAYQAKCLRCHGENGNDINFGDIVEPEVLGTVAIKNPWEAVHKILNGHPGGRMNHKIMHSKRIIHVRHHQGLIKPFEEMPYFRNDLTTKGIQDLLAYLQTLPEE